MKQHKQTSKAALFLLTAFLLTVSQPVFAYLDPSTGSMVVSAIVGIFASIALALKTYWYKIKGLFKKEQKDEAAQQDSGE